MQNDCVLFIVHVLLCVAVTLNVLSTIVQGGQNVKASNDRNLWHGWDSRWTKKFVYLNILDARHWVCIPPIALYYKILPSCILQKIKPSLSQITVGLRDEQCLYNSLGKGKFNFSRQIPSEISFLDSFWEEEKLKSSSRKTQKEKIKFKRISSKW